MPNVFETNTYLDVQPRIDVSLSTILKEFQILNTQEEKGCLGANVLVNSIIFPSQFIPILTQHVWLMCLYC